MADATSTLLQIREVAGFELSEREHRPSWSWPRHAHERASLSLVLRGSCVEQLGRFSHDCAPASLHVLPAGEPHGFRFSGPLRCLTIEVDAARSRAVREASAILEHPRQLRGPEFRSIARQLTYEMRLRDDASELALESLVLGVLAHGERMAGRTPPRWLGSIRDALHAQFREKVTLTALARVAGVHPSYLARAFRRQYGCTVGEYVRRLRLEFAAAELLAGERPVSDVAADAGFFDQSHFAHLFRRRIGMAPTEFRSQSGTNRLLPYKRR